MPNDQLKNLEGKARRVAGEHGVFLESKERLSDSMKSLLQQVREIVREAMPALSSKIIGQEMRGVQVARGGLYLDQEGNWQEYQGFKMVPISDEEVVAHGYTVEEIVGQLDVLLAAQLSGRKAEVEEKIASRALRIHAVSVLLRRD